MNKGKNSASKAGTLPICDAELVHEAAGTRPVRTMVRNVGELRSSNPDAQTLESLAESAEISMRAVHLGLGALGHLVARSSLDIRDGSVPADAMENLGFLMAELGDFAAECMRVVSECRSQLAREPGSRDAQSS